VKSKGKEKPLPVIRDTTKQGSKLKILAIRRPFGKPNRDWMELLSEFISFAGENLPRSLRF
jgi:hypothetical protein